MHPRPRTPSESALAVRSMPGVLIGTRNAVMPWARNPGRVAAKTIRTLAPSALATQVFRPVRLYAAPPSTSTAVISHVRRVGAGVLLRQRERAGGLPGCERALPHRPLGVGAEPRQHLPHQRVVHDEDGAERGARPRHRFDRQRVADVVAAAPAPRLRNRHAREPVRARQLHQRPRELARLVDARRGGLHVRLRERRHFLLEGALVGGQVEVHG